MVKSVLYRTKPVQWYLLILVYFWYITPTSHLLISFIILSYLFIYFLCLLLTSSLHLFFFFFFCSYFPLQLPEPLILFRYYNDFIGLAKESQSIIVEELEALRLSPTPVTPAQVSVELNRVLFKIKDLLRQLPPAHYKTLQFLIEHLHRYVDLCQKIHITHFCVVHY